MSNFAPGPWRRVVEGQGSVVIYAADGSVIGRFRNLTVREAATSQIITAAPKLLKFAEYVLESCGSEAEGDPLADYARKVISEAIG